MEYLCILGSIMCSTNRGKGKVKEQEIENERERRERDRILLVATRGFTRTNRSFDVLVE